MVNKGFIDKVISKGWEMTRRWYYRLNTKPTGWYAVERIPVELMGTTAMHDAGEWQVVFEGRC